MHFSRATTIGRICCGVFLAAAEAFAQSAPTRSTEWPSYGHDPGGQRYSPLRQIRRDNVARLAPAWTFDTGELGLGRATAPGTKAGFVSTPIVVDGVLYVSTPSSRVFALDPETGQKRWVFDPQEGRSPRLFNSHRGVAYWEDTRRPNDRRIFTGTIDGRLYALDAATGHPVAGFGSAGFVDLRAGDPFAQPKNPAWGARVTSPPAVWRDIVITGWGLPETPGKGPSGDVRAFDARTGREVWRFHTVPRPGEVGHETWDGDSWRERSGANVWSMMSVDVERGLVFLPVGSPTYDFWGGDRKGANLFGNALVALDAATGQRVWHFQTVHHDLWDYDLPAQPVLATLKHAGHDAPAVVQVTKSGLVFVLDRTTGTPLFPVEERPVPQDGAAPGEVLSPTQPFPVRPGMLVPDRVDPDNAFGVTIFDKAECAGKIRKLRADGLYTPPTEQGTLFLPFTGGGANWGSAAFDASRNLVIVNVNNLAHEIRLIPADQVEAVEKALEDSEVSPQRGAPFGMTRAVLASSLDLPCTPPPWGMLVAVDAAKGEIVWRKVLGDTRDLAPMGIAVKTGTPNLGGPIVTAGGVIFIAASFDSQFRAFDVKTGKVLWSDTLPASGQATPMTYVWQGRQYVVIASGGYGNFDSPMGDYVTAYALPNAE
jgi:quinoprotein glucose dehydrogenase